MMRLAEWQPGLSRDPNPDLFVEPRRNPLARIARHTRVIAALGLAAAAAVVAVLSVSTTPPAPPRPSAPVAEVPSPFLRVIQKVSLPDGSLVELKDGSHLETRFTAHERRIRLTGHEAYFTVAHEPGRPFVVEAAGVEVVALGTVFNVRIDATLVDVLVTSGRVRVAPPAPVFMPEPGHEEHPETILGAGERTSVPLLSVAPDAVLPSLPTIVAVSPEEIQTALNWKVPLLQFHETPLRVAVAEFNRHNAHEIRIADPALAETPIGGSFRIDNVEGFIRSLQLTLDVVARPQNASTTVIELPR
jgi:transmembrane sensor